MDSDNIIEVNEANFDTEVLTYSIKYPVVVDFWAEWCGPCRVIGPILEKIALEAQGSFRLAKINVDNNQNLAVRYAIRSIPFVKAFKDGKVISEFVGAQPETKIREFIRALAPSHADLAVAKGQSMLDEGQWHTAEQTFRQVIDDTPQNAPALLGLAKSLLLQNHETEALSILERFPASKEYNLALALIPLATALINFQNGDLIDEKPLDAAYHQALRLFKRGNLLAALDGLMDILRQDKRYRKGEAKQVILGILELLGEGNSVTRQYRHELAMVLF